MSATININLTFYCTVGIFFFLCRKKKDTELSVIFVLWGGQIMKSGKKCKIKQYGDGDKIPAWFETNYQELNTTSPVFLISQDKNTDDISTRPNMWLQQAKTSQEDVPGCWNGGGSTWLLTSAGQKFSTEKVRWTELSWQVLFPKTGSDMSLGVKKEKRQIQGGNTKVYAAWNISKRLV